MRLQSARMILVAGGADGWRLAQGPDCKDRSASDHRSAKSWPRAPDHRRQLECAHRQDDCSALRRHPRFLVVPHGLFPGFERSAQKPALMQLPDGVQVMFYERGGDWQTGPLQASAGRGTIIQIIVADVQNLDAAHLAFNVAFLVPLGGKWRD